ncbi:MAG: ABC transporter ATP-binding protein [Thaumarchaeota archaeon]|nr:ABC transporter ATP-binding protein [Nitrososphaerota archaeon]
MPEVVVTDLIKKFGTVQAVENVSLTVPDGKLMTLLGPSGCGKTTTLRCIAGLEDPDAGEIRIGSKVMFGQGKNVPPEARQVGMVFQSYAIWPHMKVFDNIAFPLKIRHVSSNEIKDKVRSVMQRVRLETLEDRPATDLSGGQQQRVALARALVHDPQILLLDEPLSNLDAELRDYMRIELRELQRSLGITTIYVTHDQVEALSISDHVTVLNGGKIVSTGSPRDIYVRPDNRFVASFVGKTNFIVGKLSGGPEKDHYVKVETPIGPIYCHGHGVKDTSGDVLVSIKPENIVVSDKAPTDKMNVFEGKVEVTSYLGAFTEVQVSSGGQSIRVHAKSDEVNFEKGSKVYVKFPPTYCALIAPT